MPRLVFLLAPFVAALRLYGNSSSNYTYYFSPFFPEAPKPNITAPAIVVPNIFDPQWKRDDPQLSGKIGVWIGDDPPGTFREDFVKRAAFIGLVGLVGWTSWVPEHFFEIDHSDRRLLTIPYVTVQKDELASLQAIVDAGGAEITLLDDSPNEWMIMFDSLEFYILWRVGLGIGSVLLALLAAQKLYLWYVNYRASKFFSQIAVLCLIVELLCNIERAGFFALGGLGGTRQVSWKFIRVALSISFPLTYLTTALTVAYIHDVLTATSPIGTMIAKTRKPLLCLTIFYLITDIPVSIVSAYRISSQALLLASISSLGITVGLTITAGLLLYIVIRLRRYQKKSTKPVLKGGPPTPDRLAILLDRVQVSAYCLFFTTVASIFTQTSYFAHPKGFVVIQAMILVGLMTTSYLHIVAYGRTPIRLKAKLEKEKERYLRLSQSNASPVSSPAKTTLSPKLAERGSELVTIVPSTPLVTVSPASDSQEATEQRGRGDTTRISSVIVEEENEVSMVPSELQAGSEHGEGPSDQTRTSEAKTPNTVQRDSSAEQRPPSHLPHMKTLESALTHMDTKLPEEAKGFKRSQTLASALDPSPDNSSATTPVTAQPAGLSDAQCTELGWKDARPPFFRQSSFAATRREEEQQEQAEEAPVLLEQRGPWQVIKDGLGRTYYNNTLTRMTTWTDRTQEVPLPHTNLYPEGFGVAKAQLTAPSAKPSLLEERGEWMAILAPTGHVYYHNKLSRMQTWTDPTADAVGPNRRLLLDERGHWQEILDESGQVYYNNKLTRMQTWTTPEEMLRDTADED